MFSAAPARHRRGPVPPTLAEKVAFLQRPAAYADGTGTVHAIETHLSWVFLTDAHAYKLKKPVRYDACDLTTIAARAAHCRLEIALNRRLSDDVYLGAVPLGVDGAGRMHIDRGGIVADWLIRMRRLPASRMLDALIASHALREGELEPLVARLVRFYRAQPPEPLSAADFRARLAGRIAHATAQLAAPESRLPVALVEAVAGRQLAFVEDHPDVFDRRVALGRIVEGHGDLRPEHVCLDSPPQVIDCLEFSRELRIVDPAEELGFLALECERLGAPQLKADLFDDYAARSGDEAAATLVDFYQSLHACVRATLAVAHLHERDRDDHARWAARAADYLRLAARHIGVETAG
jgi:aminoglycoside phosphotransferase family enzyme